MKARDVIGRRIVAVEQGMFDTGVVAGVVDRKHEVSALVLDNGTRLVFHTIECDDGYATDVIVQKRTR
jgi:hypothetical protein